MPDVPGRVARLATQASSHQLLRNLWVRVAAAYLTLRFVSWLLLSQAAEQQRWYLGITGPDPDHIDLALSWDAQWYQRIAEDGYPDSLPRGPTGEVKQNPWAFYPVFPMVCRALMSLTGADFASVAPVVALLAGLVAALLLAAVVRVTIPHLPDGLVIAVVAVWAANPVSPVLQFAYTESLSMALLLGYLLALVRGHWWPAGAIALVLGLTRPIALPLVLVVAAAIFLRWRASRRDEGAAVDRREAIAMAAAGVATLASGVMWPLVAWYGTGEHDAYPQTMSAWRGEASINVLEPWLRTIEWAWEYQTRPVVVPAIAICSALALALLIWVPRFAPMIDIRLKVWAAAYTAYLLAVVDGHTSILRYLLPLFPLAILAVGAHRPMGGRPASRWWSLRTTFWIVAGIVGQIGWIWWLVLFEPPADFPP